MSYDAALVDHMAERCTEVESGARNADAIISNLVMSELSEGILTAMGEGRKIQKVAIKVRKGKVQTVIS